MTPESDTRPRVLLIVDAFPDTDNPADGVFLYDQAKALARVADVGVAIGRTCSPRQWLARRGRRRPDRLLESDGFTVLRTESFVATTRSERLLVDARCRAVERAMRLFERRFGRPDVIHAHCAAFAGETALRVGRANSIPVLITEHYSFLPELMENYGRRLLAVYDEADAVFAVSQSLAQRMKELGVRREVRCVPNAVDTETFSFMPAAPPTDGRWKLVCVARDHEVKDLPVLIRALALLPAELRIEVDIVGSGEYRRARAMSGGSGLGARVRFVGPLTRAELAGRMQSCHVVASSSRVETFGMTLAEALCVGRPVVSTDSGGPRDIVRHEDGRLVPVGDSKALADAILDVLRNYDRYDQASIAASALQRFGAPAFAGRMLTEYRDAIERAERHRRRSRSSSLPVADAAVDPCVLRGMRTTVVIPTRNRPEPLARCLESLARQTIVPTEIIVADASTGDAASRILAGVAFPAGCTRVCLPCQRAGASAQRNEAIDHAQGEVLFFLDDDVVCEPSFVEEILRVFAADAAGEIGGVSGTIVNQTFVRPSRLNRAFMRLMAGRGADDYGGRLIGPAWNLLPPDARDGLRAVDWLPSCCAAYRADALRGVRFHEGFGEYSFAEDVHLSARVGRARRLVNTGRARVFHRDMGTSSHAQPRLLGRAQVVNRWVIMRDVLGRTGLRDRAKLAMLQVYFGLAELRTCVMRGGWRRALATWRGRLDGLASLLRVSPR